MLHKQPEKLTNAQIKAEREKVSKEIVSGKEKIEKLIKEETRLTEKLREMSKFFAIKEKDKKKLEKELMAKIEKLEKFKEQVQAKKNEKNKLKKEIDGLGKKEEEAIAISRVEVAKEKKELGKGIELLKKDKGSLEGQIDVLEKGLSKALEDEKGLKESIKSRKTILVDFKKSIKVAERKSANLSALVDRYDDLVKKIKESNDERVYVIQALVVVRGELKDAKKELLDTEKKRATRLKDIIKKERELNEREENINKKRIAVDNLEKRINKMGKTLQKHFDQNDMKHIKVI